MKKAKKMFVLIRTSIITGDRRFAGYILIFFLFLFNRSTQAQYDRMLIGDNNHSQMVFANLNGSNMDTLDLGGNTKSFYDAEVDPVHQKVYMAWYWGIYSMNYDGSEFDTLVSYPAGGYSYGIAVDPINECIYWGSTPEGKIFRANLDGTNKIAFLSGLGYVGDVDLDLLHGYLFYGQHITPSKGLFRTDLSGGSKTTIAAGYDVATLGLDVKNSVIYFSNGGSSRKITYAGTGDNLLFYFQPGGFFVDTASSLVYYSDITGNRILRSNLSGGNVVNLITTQLEAPHGPVLFKGCFSITTQPVNQNASAGGSAKFTLKTSGPAIHYQWQTDAGLGFQNISNAGQYSGAKDDTLLISNISMTNNNQLFRCLVSNLFCKDTTTVARLNVGSSGINVTEEQIQFKIYPNPAGSYVTVQSKANCLGAVYILTDQLGRVVLSGKLNTENTRIGLDNLPAGMYVFSIEHQAGHVYTLIKN